MTTDVDRTVRAASLLSRDRGPASDSSEVTSGDCKSTSSGEDSNCWPFGSFEWDDDWGSSSASMSTTTTGRQEGAVVDPSRQRWETDGLQTVGGDEVKLTTTQISFRDRGLVT